MKPNLQIFTERSYLHNPSLTILMKLSVDGHFDKLRFENTLQTLKNVHPLLHSSVLIDNDGEAFYQENAVEQLELHCIKREHQNQWLEVAESENKKPFNCEKGLIRFFVFYGETDFDILVAVQHLLGDGDAIARLLRDLVYVYAGNNLPMQEQKLIASQNDLPHNASLAFPTKVLIRFLNRMWNKGKQPRFGELEFQAMFHKYHQLADISLSYLTINRVEINDLNNACKAHYYIYDSSGNLKIVLPPLAADEMKTGTSWSNNSSSLIRNYAYLYKYDNYNRCIAKRLPGTQWIFYIYDKADQLIFSQDGKQRERNEWSFSIPDALGRIALTGICTNSLNYAINPLANALVKAEWGQADSETQMGYNIIGANLSSPTVLTANYYDSYKCLSLSEFSNINLVYTSSGIDIDYLKRYGDDSQASEFKHKGLLTGTLTAVCQPKGVDSTPYISSVMYYDQMKRLIQSKSTTHLGGVKSAYIAYNFIGLPLKKKQVYLPTNNLTQIELYIYTYDHAGRLLKATHQLNSNTAVTLVDNKYDELGRLKSNERNSQANLKTDYGYNIRLWTKSITGPLFSQVLYYNENRTNNTNTPCYNGNISGMDWSTDDSKSRGYDFAYDNLSQLAQANYLESNFYSDKFNTSYTYDKHGNILTLDRHGNTGKTGYDMIDRLSLSYYGNQLIKVEDKGANPSLSMSMDFKNGDDQTIEYTYDGNGNQTKDLNKGITDIKYNFLNLPERVTFSGANNPVNEYVYSATGEKLTTIHKSTTNNRTDYIGNLIYENDVLKRILVDGGYIENSVYHYYLQDYLGNNRIVAKADGTVAQVNHYYPFGMSFAEGIHEDKQPYKYNGKELDRDNDLNLYDYEARQMDPASGRFITIDPMAEKYYSWSPYVYCGNNPLKYVDPDGKDWRIQTRYNDETKMIEYHITVNAVLYNNSSNQNIDMDKLASVISDQMNDVYNISENGFTTNMDFNLKVVNSVDEIGDRDHVFQVLDQNQFKSVDSKSEVSAEASQFGLSVRIGTNLVNNLLNEANGRTVAHELGHTGGLGHLNDNKSDMYNLMMQASSVNYKFGGDYNNSTQLYHSQIKEIRDNYINNRLHQYSPLHKSWYGKKTLER